MIVEAGEAAPWAVLVVLGVGLGLGLGLELRCPGCEEGEAWDHGDVDRWLGTMGGGPGTGDKVSLTGGVTITTGVRNPRRTAEAGVIGVGGVGVEGSEGLGEGWSEGTGAVRAGP